MKAVGGQRFPAAAWAAASAAGSNVNGLAPSSAPGVTFFRSNGCSGCVTRIRSRTGADVVWSSASSNSASGTAGGRGCPVRSSAPV
ncbi:Uncharacterised protein [Mycobacterium tuberculosis]|nr:Uncharacterised protein [Mycobacterium tuberculosis]CNV84164.1 Uncharacterised protein [Mycobacterium tuberculosis]CNW34674.1 Uncharacterised protein [Mycobacterium tuberculosis]